MEVKMLFTVLAVMTYIACSSSRYATGTAYPSHSTTSSGTYKASSSSDRQLALREDVLNHARKYLGNRYRYGGTGGKGFDCSGYTSTVFRQTGLSIPRTSVAQSRFGTKRKTTQARPGDLIFFGRGSVDHVGIVMENSGNKLLVIHSTKSSGVRIDDVHAIEYWRKRLLWASDPFDEIAVNGSR